MLFRSRGQDSRRRLQDAIRSLGLRSGSTALEGGHSPQDTQRGLRDARRAAVPAGWEELLRAYTEGVAGGK